MADHFDQACRYAARMDPPGFLGWVLGVPRADLAFAGWLDTRGVEGVGDTVARLDDPTGGGPPWAVAVEFQTEPDPAMFGRLLGYLSDLWLYLRPDPERGSRFEVGAAVVNLTGTGRASRRMEWPTAGLVTHLGVVERNLAGENADTTLGRVEAGELPRCVLPWVPLMAGAETPAVIDRWKQVAAAEPDGSTRSGYAGLARLFADAAGRKELWAEALEGWDVRESSVVNEWIAEGRAEGRAEAVVEVLEERFPPVPADLAAKVRDSADAARLREWLGLAVRAADLAAFRAAAGL